MKKIALLLAILFVVTCIVKAQKPFASYAEASRFLLKRMEYSGKEGSDRFRPFGTPGTVLVSMTVKDGEAKSWKVIQVSDTSLVAGIRKACDQSMKLWAFIIKETTVIIPFYFDNLEDMTAEQQRFRRTSDTVLHVMPSKNQELVIMNTLPGIIQVATQKAGESSAEK